MNPDWIMMVGAAALPVVWIAVYFWRRRRSGTAPVDADGSRTAAQPAPTPAATTKPLSPADEAPRPKAEPVYEGLARTRTGLVGRIQRLFRTSPRLDAAATAEFEEAMIAADVGVATTGRLLERMKARLDSGGDEAAAWAALTAEAHAILDVGAPPADLSRTPSVILVVGVNGVGKTTTIGKLAAHFLASGKKVLLAAGDTFRAAAVEQLEAWGRRVGAPIVKGAEAADPSSVIFEAIQRAKAEGLDLVIADTAGRLHTKVPLMDELKKVARSVEKALGRPADEVLLVLDATNGQNAHQQAKIFKEAVAVSGIALTKLDGTAKGGVVLGIVDQHRIPIRYLGVGERVDALRPFEPATFVEALFDRSGAEP